MSMSMKLPSFTTLTIDFSIDSVSLFPTTKNIFIIILYFFLIQRKCFFQIFEALIPIFILYIVLFDLTEYIVWNI